MVPAGNAAAIQPAIDAARDAGGGSVYIPAAVYLLTEKVRVHSNVTLFGDGMDRTILRWAPGATLDHMMSNGSLTAGNSNIQIWNLTLDGQGTSSGRSDCCFGLRLNNVQNSYVINVAATGHSKDGFYLGYNKTNGAINVRLSGCRATSNARNGISLIHGSGNVIDHCQVNSNNRGEPVAGIDVEPDQDLSVTNSKIVGNVANGQNVGIQLFVQFNGYATVTGNAICQNSASGNQSAGIYDKKGSGNFFVDNSTSSNGTNFLVDPSDLVGSQYAAQCQLSVLPPVPSIGAAPPISTPTAGPTPTPAPQACQPRPQVTIASQAVGGGALRVTVSATRNASAASNTLHQIQFAAAQNGAIDVGGGQVHNGGNFTLSLPAGTQQAIFIVRRLTPGQATTVPFTVSDDCGAWPTFVGGGPSAF
jgi:parallel beta-helix repeat protein